MNKTISVLSAVCLFTFFACSSDSGNNEGETLYTGASSFSVQSSSSEVFLSSSSQVENSSSLVLLSSSSSSEIPSSSSSKELLSSSSNEEISSSSSSSLPSSSSEIGSVNYEGQTYKTVKIGEQVWMAENLNYNAEGSACYDNDPTNCEKYGRLYDWATAMTVCPNDWHLPSDTEWSILINFVDGIGGSESRTSATAGKILKATNGWNDYNGTSGNGTDDYGFTALPGGGGYFDGLFRNVDYYGHWWSATEYSASYAYGRLMDYHYENVSRDNYNTTLLFSVRCVQD